MRLAHESFGTDEMVDQHKLLSASTVAKFPRISAFAAAFEVRAIVCFDAFGAHCGDSGTAGHLRVPQNNPKGSMQQQGTRCAEQSFRGRVLNCTDRARSGEGPWQSTAIRARLPRSPGRSRRHRRALSRPAMT